MGMDEGLDQHSRRGGAPGWRWSRARCPSPKSPLHSNWEEKICNKRFDEFLSEYEWEWLWFGFVPTSKHPGKSKCCYCGIG
ncbi:unnamed protein product [Urochloa humidicola]